MARYHTNTTAIRKYRSEYYRLMKEEARLNEQLHHMLKRIKKNTEDEKQSQANHIHLTNLLAQATQQKAELEAQPASKERNKQLKKAESVWKDLNVQYKRNDLHLAVLDKKKDKDNATKYILKELKRDQVRIRIKTAYDIWKRLEQEEQYEFMDFEMFKALHFVKQVQVSQKQSAAPTCEAELSRSGTSATPASPAFATVASTPRYSYTVSTSPRFDSIGISILNRFTNAVSLCTSSRQSTVDLVSVAAV
ncbi:MULTISPECIES: hypothetical protein [Xanthocytophaga]|uniref:Uncharacterized protein n=2 Tax=Xanthocytophaga TaxID=3078918 RepID=A0AAE3QPK7_9BACT|nr:MULTISPECIES: hypothetical protein [Xanthocytophaga]MDJ1483132.1 hypothetical protein [Xanthocytophaga flavus]MDJ1503630.1 hypothetical protein [Xanthocytophaga agilis]